MFLKRLKPYARRNPYLLASSLNNDKIPEACESCYTVTRRYLENTIPQKPDPRVLDFIYRILEYFHFAKEKVWINATEYFSSFVHIHRLAYVVENSENEEYVKIKINFPYYL